MQIGAVLPQTEIGTDQASIRDFVQAMQDLGYEHVVTSDHVLGAIVALDALPTRVGVPSHLDLGGGT